MPMDTNLSNFGTNENPLDFTELFLYNKCKQLPKMLKTIWEFVKPRFMEGSLLRPLFFVFAF